MSKADKKRAKLNERIDTLEDFLKTSLGKKTSATAEIDVPGTMRQIADLKKQLEAL
jgi:uncharacterized protein YPO0396